MHFLDIVKNKKGTITDISFRPGDEEGRAVALSITGARPQKNGTIEYRPEPLIVKELLTQIDEQDIDLSQKLCEWSLEHEQEVTRLAMLQDEQFNPPLDVPNAQRLRQYQRTGAVWLKERERGILADVMGLGKTCQAALSAVATGAESVLIVCPAYIKGQWKEEIALWAKEEATDASGTVDERQETIQTRKRFLIVNYEMLQRSIPRSTKDGTTPPDYPELCSIRWDTVIFDEAHRLQNRDALQSKAAKIICKNASRVYHLTGTPIWKDLPTLWHLLHLLDPSRFPSYWDFVYMYCLTRQTLYGVEILGTRRAKLKELQSLIAEYMLRRTKEKVAPELPPKQYVTIRYEMSDAQQEAHETISYSLLLLQKGEPKYYTSRISTLIDLRTLCTLPQKLGIAPQSPKDDALVGLLEDLIGSIGKVLILCWHKDYARYIADLCKLHKWSVLLATGDITPEKRRKNVEAYTTGATQVLIGTIAAMGTGMNIVIPSKKEHAAIFAEMDWVPTMNRQSEDRLHRLTTQGNVTIYRIVGKGSIEEDILSTSDHTGHLSDEALAIDAVVERLRTRYYEAHPEAISADS